MSDRLLDAAPLGLLPGDMKTGAGWTRNVAGEQVLLPLEESSDVAEAIAILEGRA